MIDVKWNADGLLPAVAQDRLTGQVRMVAWMNREALEATLASGEATFYSRSRAKLWRKGETSGHVMKVSEVALDCDADTLLLMVDPAGPSCHTGHETCFFQPLRAEGDASAEREVAPFMLTLEAELAERAKSTGARSYTRSLLDGGIPKINAKINEEALEVCAALANESDERVASEMADLVYHLLVGLRARDMDWRQVMEVLASRSGRSGLEEKASRTPKPG